jgi:hypothetical protein
MTPEKWESPETYGFEVRIPSTGNEFLAIRVDRRAKLCIIWPMA